MISSAPSSAPVAAQAVVLETSSRPAAAATRFRPDAVWLLTGGTLLLAWTLLWNKLRVDWSVNDQYKYGWFIPPLALALCCLRWPDRPPPRLPGAAAGRGKRAEAWLALLAGGCLALLLPVRLIEEPNADWRLLFWAHALVLATLSLAALAWCGGKPWVRHFAFPVAFLLLAVPWPSGPEEAVIQSMMRGVAILAAEGMNLLGIPALAQGNVIHIRDRLVGVDEACSGIRSLQTTLMAALLLGELSRLSWRRRLAVLGGGLALAMLANVFRSSLLVWLAANYGPETLERFHDIAGVSVLLIVFAGLVWLNARLSRRAAAPAPATAPVPVLAGRRVPRWFLIGAAAWLLTAETGTALWYGSREQGQADAVRWTAVPPAGAPGFQNVRIDDRSARMLRFDQGLQARWTRPVGTGAAADCTLYFFRWEPGRTSATLAAMHQPHICLTASGLTQVADWGVQPLALPNGLSLPVRRYEFLYRGQPLYIFYVVWQDRVGEQAVADGPGSRWDRLRAVAERRRNVGQQSLEFIVNGLSDPEQARQCFEREMAAIVKKG